MQPEDIERDPNEPGVSAGSDGPSCVLTFPVRTSHVLVVDDDEKNRLLLRTLLEHKGYRVTEAGSGEDAIQQVDEDAPDVILLDVILPVMDGYQVCRRLKSNAATALIPVLMISSLSKREDRMAGIEAGAQDFLTKPCDSQEVLLRVRNACFSKQLMDDAREDARQLRNVEAQHTALKTILSHDRDTLPMTLIDLGMEMLTVNDVAWTERAAKAFAAAQEALRELKEATTDQGNEVGEHEWQK